MGRPVLRHAVQATGQNSDTQIKLSFQLHRSQINYLALVLSRFKQVQVDDKRA
jgi:hypothetical protein